MIIGSLLLDKRYAASIGMRWYVFPLTGLGKAINEWDRAADIMLHFLPKNVCPGGMVNPPEYTENSLYGRKIMVRLLLSLLARVGIFSGSNTVTHSNDQTVLEEMIIIFWMMVLFELILIIQMTSKIDNDYNEKSLQKD